MQQQVDGHPDKTQFMNQSLKQRRLRGDISFVKLTFEQARLLARLAQHVGQGNTFGAGFDTQKSLGSFCCFSREPLQLHNPHPLQPKLCNTTCT